MGFQLWILNCINWHIGLCQFLLWIKVILFADPRAAMNSEYCLYQKRLKKSGFFSQNYTLTRRRILYSPGTLAPVVQKARLRIIYKSNVSSSDLWLSDKLSWRVTRKFPG